MRISLLGELEVFDDAERPIVITGAKQRALLAALALHPGHVIPADRLVDILWGEDPPPAVRNGLQGLVSKLRRLVGADRIVTRGAGYCLEVAPDAVDVHRFEHLVAQGRTAVASGDLPHAVALLGEAVEMWRGEALADLAHTDVASGATVRWSELRLAAIDERLDAELQLGRPGVVADLEAVVAAHPLRERPRGLLMVALYRAGRQAEALRVAREGRRILAEELGLDPDRELQRLEAAILAQDPSLSGPDPAPDAGPAAPPRFTVPMALTPLVGRDREVGEVTALVGRHRLVTLVGPGGVGKTRLALEAAQAIGAGLTDGACLVELAPVGDPAAVSTAIAAAVGLADHRQLLTWIGDREVLIVLDNCEHVIATAAEVAEQLLRRCPHLRLLATSREGLRIGGEALWPVPPLAREGAAALFVARADAAGARLDVNEELAGTIAQICDRLDGLPLAIELAAARLRAFSSEQILSRLNDRFRLLTGGSRTALPRQQTLRAVVDWSYDLLFDDEQRVFTRLSVLPGGCDLAAARAVCGGGELGAFDIDDVIQALVDKSLVNAAPGTAGVRFAQLQTLAQYGREKLAEREEGATVRDAMAAHFAQLCSRSAAAYIGAEQRAWLIAVGQEHDNLRAALGWAVANGDAETALTIAGGASWQHWLASTAAEGKRWLDDAFGCTGAVSDVTRAMALTGRALIDVQLGVGEAVDADLEEALAVFRRHGDPAPLAFAHSFYAEVPAARGQFDEARRRRRDLLAFYESLPDDAFVLAARAYSSAKLGVLDGDLAGAERWYRDAAERFSQLDRPMMLAMCLGMVADFDERAGDHPAAIAALRRAIDLNAVLGLDGFNGALLARLGWALLHADDASSAAAAFRRALELARPLDNGPVIFVALAGMSVVHHLDGHQWDAADLAAEALEVHRAETPRRLANRVDPASDALAATAACCTVLGCAAVDAGAAERGAELLGHAARLRADARVAELPRLVEEGARALEAARGLLGPEGCARSERRGREGSLPAGLDVRR